MSGVGVPWAHPGRAEIMKSKALSDKSRHGTLSWGSWWPKSITREVPHSLQDCCLSARGTGCPQVPVTASARSDPAFTGQDLIPALQSLLSEGWWNAPQELSSILSDRRAPVTAKDIFIHKELLTTSLYSVKVKSRCFWQLTLILKKLSILQTPLLHHPSPHPISIHLLDLAFQI